MAQVAINAAADGLLLLAVFVSIERARPVVLVGAVFYLSAYGAIGGVALSLPLALGVSSAVAATELIAGPAAGVDGFTVAMFGAIMLLQVAVLDRIAHEIRVWAKRLDLLESTVDTVTAEQDRSAILNASANAVREAVDAYCVTVLLCDGGELHLAAIAGESESVARGCALLLDAERCAVDSLAGTAVADVLASGRMASARVDRPEQRARLWPPAITETGIGSAVYLPLHTDESVVGVLNVYLPGTHGLSGQECGLLNSYAERASRQLQRAEAEEQKRDVIRRWEQTAHTDELTGTANRRGLNLALRRLSVDRHDPEATLSLIMIDVDHFKDINDMHNHLVGDQVLQAVAHTIVRHLRPGDVVGRWGGDEFLVILPGVDIDSAAQVAERIVATVCNAPVWDHHGKPVSATVSVGVASARTADLDQVMTDVDEALHAAKTDGRNTVHVVQPQ